MCDYYINIDIYLLLLMVIDSIGQWGYEIKEFDNICCSTHGIMNYKYPSLIIFHIYTFVECFFGRILLKSTQHVCGSIRKGKYDDISSQELAPDDYNDILCPLFDYSYLFYYIFSICAIMVGFVALISQKCLSKQTISNIEDNKVIQYIWKGFLFIVCCGAFNLWLSVVIGTMAQFESGVEYGLEYDLTVETLVPLHLWIDVWITVTLLFQLITNEKIGYVALFAGTLMGGLVIGIALFFIINALFY